MEYPIYKRNKDGNNYHKILGTDRMLSVFNTPLGSRILLSLNPLSIEDAINTPDCEAEDFEKSYFRAMSEIIQANQAGAPHKQMFQINFKE